MPTLATPLRRELEKAVIEARKVAEQGADAFLTYVGYADTDRPTHLSAEDAQLRTALRARGRQLGEAKGETGVRQGQRPLIEEIAYEQWHRMLFARFLAENGLLRHPEGASLTIELCAELAPDEGARDGWDLAARYAGLMLPGLFRASDPAVRVRLAREHYLALEGLVEGLPADVFSSDDGLGWVYQFWQTERKKQVNAEAKSRGTKIGAAELPAVTQLFTEPYMVDFLLQNTLGAWWAGKYPDSPLLAEMPYLRWDPSPTPPRLDSSLRSSSPGEGLTGAMDKSPSPDASADAGRGGVGEGSIRRPAAGTFDGWAKTVAGLKVLDPCCGSGHFLVAAFGWLRRMREAEEGVSEGDAADAVLRDNLFGLELDRRCTQIAMFNIALAAWRVGGAPERHVPQVHCSGTASGNANDWFRLARRDSNLQNYAAAMTEAFKDAPIMGSLIDPVALTKGVGLPDGKIKRVDDGSTRVSMRTYSLIPYEDRREQAKEFADQLGVRGQRDLLLSMFMDSATEVAHVASILSSRYDLIVTNVPYLSRASQHETLRVQADERYATAKADLATIFLDRCLSLGETGGTVAAVTPQNWLFLGAYRKLREDLLVSRTLDVIARLGPGAFETVTGEVVSVALVALTAQAPLPDTTFAGIDVSSWQGPLIKNEMLRTQSTITCCQSDQLDSADSRISFDSQSPLPLLQKYANGIHGFGTKDAPRFVRKYWEIGFHDSEWSYMQTTTDTIRLWNGMTDIVYWQQGQGILRDYGRKGWAIPVGASAWGKRGVSVSQMGMLPASLSTGDIFDKNVAVVLPHDPSHLPAIWSYCSSTQYGRNVRKIDQSLAVTNATLVKVPFDLEHWTKVAQEQYPNGLPEPHSDDPTQWLFTGHPKGSDDPLHVALARLLGCRWPDQPEDDHGLKDYIDPDGIVCLPAVAGEQPAHLRLRELLRAAWGDDWRGDLVDTLVAGAGSPGTTLEDWLRDDAFKQHCALFHNRPFLWHVWDGRKDGFSAIVNYHRLDAALLDKLTYTYLGDWIGRQREAAQANVPGAQARSDAALELQRRLELIRQGEAPYDIYVRWKPLDRQPIGWAPDLDDGVRLNVRPFIEAGVLRVNLKTKVKWGKDRGANPEGADVYRWSEDAQRAAGIPVAEVNGKDRLNDLHLSLTTKRAAREETTANPEVAAAPGGRKRLVD